MDATLPGLAPPIRCGSAIFLLFISVAASVQAQTAYYETANVTLTCPQGSSDVAWIIRTAVSGNPLISNDFDVIATSGKKLRKYADDSRYRIVLQSGSYQTLYIDGLRLSDAGNYSCGPLFDTGDTSGTATGVYAKWHIDVFVFPGEPRLIQNRTSNEGEEYSVYCAVDGGRPQVEFRWQIILQDETYMDFTTASVENFYTVYENNTSDAVSRVGFVIHRKHQGAMFVCNAFQHGLERYYNKSVTASLSNARFPPTNLSMTKQEGQLVEHQSTEFACTANYANPPAEITWSFQFHDGTEEIEAFESSKNEFRGYYSTQSQIALNITRRHSGGELSCYATNEVRTAVPLRAFQTLNVDFAPYPEIFVPSEPRPVLSGDSLEIPCVLAAEPSANRTGWYLDGSIVDVDATSRFSMPEPGGSIATMIISSITRHDAGTWQCFASNYVGTGFSDQYTVDVLHAPGCRSGQKVKYGISKRNAVVMTCNVDSNPNNVNFTWEHNGKVVQDREGVADDIDKYLAYDTFTITPREDSDYGIYYCSAQNVYGEIESRCELALQLPGPADAPADCRVVSPTSESFNITCTETFTGGSTEAWYALMIFISGGNGNEVENLQSNHTSPEYSLQDLMPATRYRFRVCATNFQFWQEKSCTTVFEGVTLTADGRQLNSTGDVPVYSAAETSRVRSAELSDVEIYTIVGSVGGALVLISIVIAVGVCSAVMKKQDKKAFSNQGLSSTNRITEPSEESRTRYSSDTTRSTLESIAAEAEMTETELPVPTPYSYVSGRQLQRSSRTPVSSVRFSREEADYGIDGRSSAVRDISRDGTLLV